MEAEDARAVVIVGGGICGLASALALHRNGIASVVLEKSKKLRATGSAIIVQPNGWRALDQLGFGVASFLRQTSLPIRSGRYISIDSTRQDDILLGKGELRCVKRIDLIKSLADKLPSGTLKLGCGVASVKLDPFTCGPLLQLQDGNILHPQVVIGCDGMNSNVAEAVGLSPPRTSTMCVIRGITIYENGHGLDNEFVVLGKDGLQLGRMPIDDNHVYWFLTRKWTTQDLTISIDPTLIRQSSAESLKGFPVREREMVSQSDLPTLHLTGLKYRAPWDLLWTNFRRGAVVVAGDAMHAMGPFLAQGGSAALEDAIALARCLSPLKVILMGLNNRPPCDHDRLLQRKSVEAALAEFVMQRKRRVVGLSTQTYLTGLLVQSSSSGVAKFAIGILISILFGGEAAHTTYDCGTL